VVNQVDQAEGQEGILLPPQGQELAVKVIQVVVLTMEEVLPSEVEAGALEEQVPMVQVPLVMGVEVLLGTATVHTQEEEEEVSEILLLRALVVPVEGEQAEQAQAQVEQAQETRAGEVVAQEATQQEAAQAALESLYFVMSITKSTDIKNKELNNGITIIRTN
jgi:hypothetical protein